MTTEDWFDALTAELLQQSPFRRSEYFRRFASGALSRADVWGHIAQHYLLIAWFPRIFSGIHTRCEDFEVRKDCARHLLVEDLGYFDGRVGGTPDHDELFRRIRSEEHTSELQSHSDLVCRLLLEKKKIRSTPSICTVLTPAAKPRRRDAARPLQRT